MIVRGTTRVAAVIGWPVEHSRSPAIINAAFAATGIDAVLVPIGAPPESLAAVVRGLVAMRALGASVTVPHKVAVAALCDELSAAAREIGAVNCLQIEGDRVVGHNTDCDGFVDGLAVTPRHVVLLGAGGAARAVAYGLRRLGADVEVIARRPDELEWTSRSGVSTVLPWTDEALRKAFARSDLVVDTTPVGLGSPDEAAFVDALPLDALPRHAVVTTLVYHRWPLLLERAAARGHSVDDGRGMLVHQGARAFARWTGNAAPIEAMTRALDESIDGSIDA